MFYLKKKTKVSQIKEGEIVMVLADFTGIRAGTLGRVEENYGTGVMIHWFQDEAKSWSQPLRDGFGEDELEYLAFQTEKHPKHE